MDEFDLMADTKTTCYEILQLRRTMKFLIDDIYTGVYSPEELCTTIPLVMGLAETIQNLQTSDYL